MFFLNKVDQTLENLNLTKVNVHGNLGTYQLDHLSYDYAHN
jgi:hypothetical protein